MFVLVAGAYALAGVFEYGQAAAFGNGHDFVHLTGPPIEVNGEYDLGTITYSLCEFGGVHIKGLRVYIDDYRLGLAIKDCIDSSNKSGGWDDYFIAGLDAEQLQSHM